VGTQPSDTVSTTGPLFSTYRDLAGARSQPTSLSEPTLTDLRHVLEDLVLDAPAGTLVSGYPGEAGRGPDPTRYARLADGHDAAIVLGSDLPAPDGVHTVRPPDGHPLGDEWFTLAAAETFTALMVAQPEGTGPDGEPRLTTLWSFDPDVIAPVARQLVDALADVDGEASAALAAGLERHPPRPPAPGVQQAFTNAVFVALESGRQQWRAHAKQLEVVTSRLEHAEQRAGHQSRLAAAGTVAASVAHDINSPLSTITMAIALLRQAEDTAQRPALLGTIERAAMRAGRIAQDLLDYAGDHALRRHRMDLGAWLVDWLDGDLGDTSALDIPDQPVLIDADPDRLEQVLGNLLDNARQAPGRDAPVRFRLLRTDGRATIEISDDGSGVPGDLLDHIFEPFVSSKRAGEGTGLGLAIVAALVERHGGEVELASTGPGGTTFAVHLPLAENADLEPGDPRAEVLDERGLARPLVEDDDPVTG
jgi:signal transduction histidine kinase